VEHSLKEQEEIERCSTQGIEHETVDQRCDDNKHDWHNHRRLIQALPGQSRKQRNTDQGERIGSKGVHAQDIECDPTDEDPEERLSGTTDGRPQEKQNQNEIRRNREGIHARQNRRLGKDRHEEQEPKCDSRHGWGFIAP